MTPLERARLSLTGLCLGDSFGARFFFGRGAAIEQMLARRAAPMGNWRYTDDTAMACELVLELAEHGAVVQDSLAQRFARQYQAEPGRGYGSGARRILERIAAGVHWTTAAAEAFQGKGSLGNGAAMRVAPLGAFFAADLERVTEQARRSAEVTHAHPEGVAGAVAVALAAAFVFLGQQLGLAEVASHLTPGPTRAALELAAELEVEAPEAARLLGRGDDSLASTTVPLALWCVQRFGSSYTEALWQAAVAAPKDRDTVCAIVGGIVAGQAALPEEWLVKMERPPALA